MQIKKAETQMIRELAMASRVRDPHIFIVLSPHFARLRTDGVALPELIVNLVNSINILPRWGKSIAQIFARRIYPTARVI